MRIIVFKERYAYLSEEYKNNQLRKPNFHTLRKLKTSNQQKGQIRNYHNTQLLF